MYKYDMDPTKTVGATERTPDEGRTDRQIVKLEYLEYIGGGGGGGGGLYNKLDASNGWCSLYQNIYLFEARCQLYISENKWRYTP